MLQRLLLRNLDGLLGFFVGQVSRGHERDFLRFDARRGDAFMKHHAIWFA